MLSTPPRRLPQNPFKRLMGVLAFLLILPFGLIFGLVQGLVDLRKALRVDRRHRQE